MKIYFLILTTALFTAGCGEQKQYDDLEEQITGQWRNVSIRVTVNAGTDSAKTFSVTQENWEDVLGIRPIRTFYLQDGTYYSEYYDLNDSLVRKPSGNWKLNGDTLVMEQTSPTHLEEMLQLSIKDTRAEFRGYLDWDLDGARDDYYFGVQQKYPD